MDAAGLDSAGAAYSAWRIGLLGSLALVEAWCGQAGSGRGPGRRGARGGPRRRASSSTPSPPTPFWPPAWPPWSGASRGGRPLALREGSLRAEANRRAPLGLGRSPALGPAAGRRGPPRPGPGHHGRSPDATSGAPPPPGGRDGLLALRCRLLRVCPASPDEAAAPAARDGRPTRRPSSGTAATALTLGHDDRARKILDGGAWTGDRAQARRWNDWCSRPGWPRRGAHRRGRTQPGRGRGDWPSPRAGRGLRPRGLRR